MDNGLAIMPAPIFLVTDDPKATAGSGGNDHLLDVRRLRLFWFLPFNLRPEGQLPPCYIRWYGTDYDRRTGDPCRNARPILQ